MSSITFLGTGPGNVVAGRFQSSILLEVGGKRVLLDAGEPCSTQLLDLGFRLPDLDARYPLEIFSWQSGQALVMDTLAVRPFPTTHLDGLRKLTGNDQVESFLFEITAAERRFVYSGDLGAPSDLNEILKEPLDLLICELSHFTPEELASALQGARVGTLCLTHVATEFDERRGEIQMLIEREPGIDSVYLPDDGERIDF